jgi:hypothetical protein
VLGVTDLPLNCTDQPVQPPKTKLSLDPLIEAPPWPAVPRQSGQMQARTVCELAQTTPFRRRPIDCLEKLAGEVFGKSVLPSEASGIGNATKQSHSDIIKHVRKIMWCRIPATEIAIAERADRA